VKRGRRTVTFTAEESQGSLHYVRQYLLVEG